MQTYKEYRPTGFDHAGAFLPDRQEWYVVPCGQNRDSDALAKSNFRVALRLLGGETEGRVEVHRFGHWACGWFELILVHPTLKDAVQAIEDKLEGYPVLDEDDYTKEEMKDANETWQHCFDDRERLEYILEHRSQFEFYDMADLMGCVRGRFFNGYASELLN